MSNRAKLKDIKAGATLWHVHALGKNSFLTKMPITRKPFTPSNTGSLFLEYTYESELTGRMVIANSSALDGNIIPNQYNFHKVFLTENSAKRYMQQCVDYDYDSTCIFEWDYIDDYHYDDTSYEYGEAQYD